MCFLYVSESFKADIKAAGFFLKILFHISDLNAKSSLVGGENGKCAGYLFILHFLKSHGALNNLMCLGELLLDT